MATRSNHKDNDRPITEQTPLLAPAAGAGDGSQAEHGHAKFAKGLTATDGFFLLITVIVGSGIFASPSAIDTNVPSPGVALLIWAAGGLLAWTGASTLAELGAALPGEGGIQEYCKYVYGDWAGFLAAWTWITAVMPATLSILGIVFVETVYEAVLPGSEGATGSWEQKGFSVLVVFMMLSISALGTKISTTLNTIGAIIKLLAIFLVILAGVVVAIIYSASRGHHDPGGRDWHAKGWFDKRISMNPDGSTIDWNKVSSWETFGHVCTAIYAALWAYAGWDKANYAASELQDPAKQLPLAINTAVPLVTACYVLTNAAYYIIVPWKIVGTTDAIAVTAMTNLLGKPAALIMALLIMAVVLGALNGNIFVAGRLTVAAAHKGYLPKFFGYIGHVRPRSKAAPAQVSPSSEPPSSEPSPPADETEPNQPRFNAPQNAYILSLLLTSIYIISFDFRFLLTFDGLAEYTFFFLTVLGALILRFTRPELERPYKPFIVLPGIFVVVSGAVVVRGAIFAPVQTGVLGGLLVLGLGGYFGVRWIGRWRGEA